MYAPAFISILIRAMTARRRGNTGAMVHGPIGNDAMATGVAARLATETIGGATGSPATQATVSTANDLGGTAVRPIFLSASLAAQAASIREKKACFTGTLNQAFEWQHIDSVPGFDPILLMRQDDHAIGFRH